MYKIQNIQGRQGSITAFVHSTAERDVGMPQLVASTKEKLGKNTRNNSKERENNEGINNKI